MLVLAEARAYLLEGPDCVLTKELCKQFNGPLIHNPATPAVDYPTLTDLAAFR